jgi:hypothetical protein
VPYVTKNAQIVDLKEIAQERLEEVDALQKENRQLIKDRNDRQEITAAAFDRENTYRWQREELDKLRKLKFKAEDIWDLSAQLTIEDISALLNIFRDRIVVQDRDSPFTHETDYNESFCYRDKSVVVVDQTLSAPYRSDGLKEGSTFVEWLQYAPRNVKSDYCQENVYTDGVKIKFHICNTT